MLLADAVTPAFVYDSALMRKSIDLLRACGNQHSEFSILFTLKACGISGVLSRFADVVDGWAVASPSEVLIANQVKLDGQSKHLASPGLVASWLDDGFSPDFVSFNSLTQMRRCAEASRVETSCGLRLNPKISIVSDLRYDACRDYSKLGVSLEDFVEAWSERQLDGIVGLHLHNACLSDSWHPLLRTVLKLKKRCDTLLHEFEWINLGGGHVWNGTTDFGPLAEAVDLLTNCYGLKVFLEPGAGVVNSAGTLISSVVDLFRSDGKMIAVLDTTVNHLPEVFEYQFEPDVREHTDDGRHHYILAGCSCLAGDVFGEYAFRERLQVGTRVTFENVGAYSFVKAHMFNGINLPSIYLLGETDELELIKRFTFDDFANHCGFLSHEYANR